MANTQLGYQAKQALPNLEPREGGRPMSEDLDDGIETEGGRRIDAVRASDDWIAVITKRVATLDRAFRSMVNQNPASAYLIAVGFGVGLGVVLSKRSAKEEASSREIH